jgi:flagellar L-ring protein precursor FlgH
MPTLDKQTPRPSAGAIFNSDSKNLYQDSRAHNIGDILMVKIVENSSADKNAETTTSHDSTLKGGVSSFFGYESLLRGKGGASHIPSLTSMNADLAKDFHGKGETKRDSKVTATISARVVDVSMNGNLMIRGYQEVRVNNETQHIILSGIVRPEDVAQDNSILSSYIADARIEYNGIGVLSSRQQPGWLSNVIDVIWPF